MAIIRVCYLIGSDEYFAVRVSFQLFCLLFCLFFFLFHELKIYKDTV